MIFENSSINLTDLPDFEAVALTPISRNYGVVVAFNTILFTIILLSAFLVFHFVEPLFFGIYFPSVLTVIFVFLVAIYLITYFSFFTKKYGIRSHDLIYQSGLLKKTTTIIPFSRVQHVDLEEGWLSGMLGIKSVVVYTAGQNGGDIKINGLEKELAESINQLVLNKINTENPVMDEGLNTEIEVNEA